MSGYIINVDTLQGLTHSNLLAQIISSPSASTAIYPWWITNPKLQGCIYVSNHPQVFQTPQNQKWTYCLPYSFSSPSPSEQSIHLKIKNFLCQALGIRHHKSNFHSRAVKRCPIQLAAQSGHLKNFILSLPPPLPWASHALNFIPFPLQAHRHFSGLIASYLYCWEKNNI